MPAPTLWEKISYLSFLPVGARRPCWYEWAKGGDMKKLGLGLVLLGCIAWASAARAEGPSAADIIARAESADQNTRTVALIYISGIVAGIFGVEALHLHEGKPLVFCTPANLLINANDLVQLAKAHLKAIPALQVLDFQTVSIKALQAKYPCR
jgi:hypothetical protein